MAASTAPPPAVPATNDNVSNNGDKQYVNDHRMADLRDQGRTGGSDRED